MVDELRKKNQSYIIFSYEVPKLLRIDYFNFTGFDGSNLNLYYCDIFQCS